MQKPNSKNSKRITPTGKTSNYDMIIDIPDEGPYAAAALIIHPTGLILGVSRKHDQTDFGCAGGKVEPGQSFSEACTEEVLQETGLTVVKMKPIYGARCGTEGLHHVHWNLVFLCKVEGRIHTTEKGKVAWIPPNRLVVDEETGKMQSFGDYNRAVFQRIKDENISLDGYISDIPLEEGRILEMSCKNPGWLNKRF